MMTDDALVATDKLDEKEVELLEEIVAFLRDMSEKVGGIHHFLGSQEHLTPHGRVNMPRILNEFHFKSMTWHCATLEVLIKHDLLTEWDATKKRYDGIRSAAELVLDMLGERGIVD